MDKSTFLINMGRRIAKARKDVGLSQAYLAEKADISEIHMSNIERGKKNPSADVTPANSIARNSRGAKILPIGPIILKIIGKTINIKPVPSVIN